MKALKKNRLSELFFIILFIMFSGLFFVRFSYADYSEDLKEQTPEFTSVEAEPVPSYLIKPVSKITIQDFYYSGYHKEPFYCFENSEGRCLDKQYNLYVTVEGKAEVDNKFFVYYKTELNEDGVFKLKKGYGLLRAGIWSFEVGKDTVWVGPGYHGSFLLSNNAEGFLLARVRTEDPFRLPWFLSSIGEFKYDIFRGWSDNSSLLGQRLSYRPMPLLEFGFNQVAYIPPGKDYGVNEYHRVFFSSADNAGTGKKAKYDNDQKASIDVALDLPFLNKITPFVNGRIYAEYAGNDTYAAWQTEDKNNFKQEPGWKKLRWPFQFDFLNIAWMSGLFLTTGDLDFRFEYAQNHSSYPLFYDLYKKYGSHRRQGPWYSNLNVRQGMIMGDAMGNNADDYFFQVVKRRGPLKVELNFDVERHWLPDDHPFSSTYVSHPPETRYQYGLRPSYAFKSYTLFADLIYNHYRNVNFSTYPTVFDIHPGIQRDEFIAGLGSEFYF